MTTTWHSGSLFRLLSGKFQIWDPLAKFSCIGGFERKSQTVEGIVIVVLFKPRGGQSPCGHSLRLEKALGPPHEFVFLNYRFSRQAREPQPSECMSQIGRASV